jgi:hypothetical protein
MASSDAMIDANRPAPDACDAVRPQIARPVHEMASGPLSADIDWGQPVDDPPPFVEPVGYDEPPSALPAPILPPVQPSPRRTLLAPLLAVLDGRRDGVEAPTPAAAALTEPVAPPTRADRWKIPARLLLQVQQWRAAAAIPRFSHRPRVLYSAIVAGAAVVVVAALYFGGVVFHRSAGTAGPVPSAPADRFAYFQRGAQAGDPEAELQLGILYAKGDGVAQDYATAAMWFRMAADQGSARAQYDLGVLYERGRGVDADPEQAASWYLKAAEGKYALAQYNLAVAYTKGQGTRKDLTEAALWYRRAAGQGVVQAMANLGMLYERGDGTAVSPADAYAWYLAAGRRGDQASARRAEDVFNGMSRLDQIRAEALASDVAGSIHDALGSGAAPSG